VIFPYQGEALLVRRTEAAAKDVVKGVEIAMPDVCLQNPGTEKLCELIKRRELDPVDGVLRFGLWPLRGSLPSANHHL
jgi:hypothetical protein